MDTNSLFAVWDAIIPIIMIIYGIKLWQDPPKYGEGDPHAGNKGLPTKYTQLNRETWKEGNKFGGKLIALFGAIIGILTLVDRYVLKGEAPLPVRLGKVVIELALILIIVPLVNAHIKKKFNIRK